MQKRVSDTKLNQPSLPFRRWKRLKLVTQLTRGRPKVTDLGSSNTNLYLIEEPTIRLHLQDVARLTNVLRLVDEGHTVVVIEHHMDLAAEADIIDGTGGRSRRRTIVAQGLPKKWPVKDP